MPAVPSPGGADFGSAGKGGEIVAGHVAGCVVARGVSSPPRDAAATIAGSGWMRHSPLGVSSVAAYGSINAIRMNGMISRIAVSPRSRSYVAAMGMKRTIN
ncbi:MAG: hypothetical protein QOF78_3035 [Phycisphaerales bacterium]|nr:hypothetical protein [Phycisphaerales bacterium]